MAKMFFEMPELLNLDGSVFQGLYNSLEEAPNSCMPGCADGCAGGCQLGTGSGAKPDATGLG
ncbi:MAG: hypothetical protein ACM3SY_01630 [Candidatus Omnitrophota bacterium]